MLNANSSFTMSEARIQVLSDLHLETPRSYDIYTITPKAPYLALVGDIGNVGDAGHREDMLAFLAQQLRAFKAVFFVPGNHESFEATWPEVLSVLRSFEEDTAMRRKEDAALGAFVLMDRGSFRIPAGDCKDTLVLGCSLFSRVPDERAAAVEMGLNDFYRTRGWDVAMHNTAHTRDLTWLNNQVTRADDDDSVGDVLILTHWSPSLDPRANDPRHAGSSITSGFSTDLSGEMCMRAEKVAVWASGHTHFNFDFSMDRGEEMRPLRLLANQRGYYFSQAPGFDPEKVIEI